MGPPVAGPGAGSAADSESARERSGGTRSAAGGPLPPLSGVEGSVRRA